MGTGNFSVSQDVDGTFLLKGELTIHDLEYFKDFVDNSFARSKTVSLSLAQMSFLDAASLQFLICYRKNLGKSKAWKIRDLSPEVEQILEVTGTRQYLIPE
ncbi:MAG: STAS domain-containing protein [Desulfatibacillaceae bacterium]